MTKRNPAGGGLVPAPGGYQREAGDLFGLGGLMTIAEQPETPLDPHPKFLDAARRVELTGMPTDGHVMRVRVRRLPSRYEQLICELHLYRRAHGYWPQIRELAEPLGYYSSSGAYYRLRQAVKAGYVLSSPGGARQYRPNYARLVIETQHGVITVWSIDD